MAKIDQAKAILTKYEFNQLHIIDKIDQVQDLLLNSIFECIIEGRAKLPDLVKAQTIFNRSILLKQKQRDPLTNKFISTPRAKESEDE